MIAADEGLPPITQATLRDYCGGAQLTMVPYATAGLSMAIASVIQGTGRDWEYDNARRARRGQRVDAGLSDGDQQRGQRSHHSGPICLHSRNQYSPPIRRSDANGPFVSAVWQGLLPGLLRWTMPSPDA